MKFLECDIAIIGAGIVGVATAYYLKKISPDSSIVLIDSDQPMSFTSAQSGENYRNWWPHPIMTAFTDRSIDLMEALAIEDNNTINMNRRGYVLSTRETDVDQLMDELVCGYSELDNSAIRVHEKASGTSYRQPTSPIWEDAPTGVDVVKDTRIIQQNFPSYAEDIRTVVHIRRAGAISGQQMGQLMLRRFKDAGGIRVQAQVSEIEVNNGFNIRSGDGAISVNAERLVNAAGPFINTVAHMLGTSLPITNTLQQKIAFEDTAKAIPRAMPFSIDLDAQQIDWSEDELQLLAESLDHQWLTKQMPGAIHCRPDGGDNGTWLKLGWAYNDAAIEPNREPVLSDGFPEIVLRGAARLNPGLKAYYEQLTRSMHHYGGYYTLTEENWPLIGAMDTDGCYVVGAMSGFGTMAACAAGDLCARVMLEKDIPHYAEALSPQRYQNSALMAELHTLAQRGIL